MKLLIFEDYDLYLQPIAIFATIFFITAPTLLDKLLI